MLSLRPIATLASLLALLLISAHASPSAATTISPQGSAAISAADCAIAATHCVFMPWMRVPAPAPTLQLLRTVPGDSATVETHGAYAYIGQWDSLAIVDVSDPQQPREVGRYRFQSLGSPLVQDIEVQPPLAYVTTLERISSCCIDARVQLLDIAQPAQPRLLASTSDLGGSDIEVAGQRVYAAGLRWPAPWPDLAIADVVGSSSFLDRGSYGSNGSWSVAVKDSIVYVADNENRILVIDASNPDSLVVRETVSTPEMPYAVEIDGSYLYVAMTNSLAIFDLSTPTAPAVRSIRPLLGFPLDLEVAGGWAYVALGAQGLTIVDVRNPDDTALLTSYQPAGEIRNVEVDGALIYLAGSNGTQIMRVGQP